MSLLRTSIVGGLSLLPFTGFALENLNSLDCVIEPFETVEASSQVRGILEEVYVTRGDLVEKGQIIAKLVSGVEESSVNLARARANTNIDILAKHARFELAKRTYDRTLELAKKNLISTAEKDEAETAVSVAEFDEKKSYFDKKLARLELEQSIEVLNLRSLKSPINGVVAKRYKNPGEYVEEDPVVKLVQNDPLRVEVIAPLSMFGQIKKGQKAIVKPEMPIGGEYVAEVLIVDQIIDPSSATFGIRLELNNPEYLIPSGLQCAIEFIEEESE